jgi:hypothetical protein
VVAVQPADVGVPALLGAKELSHAVLQPPL